MSTYVFPGYPSFLTKAEAELGRPGSAAPARRIGPLTALANLCAQAAHGDPAHAGAILARAAEFRDQLATALLAAELMLLDVEFGLRAPIEPPKPEVESGAEPSPTPTDRRTARRGPGSYREPS